MVVLQCCCSPFPVLSSNLGLWVFYLDSYFRVLSLYYRVCLWLLLLLQFIHFSLTYSSFLVRHPSVCISFSITSHLSYFLSFHPSLKELRRKLFRTLCSVWKVRPSLPALHLFSCGWWVGHAWRKKTALPLTFPRLTDILQMVIRGNETRCRSLSKLLCYSNFFKTYSRQMLLGESNMNS